MVGSKDLEPSTVPFFPKIFWHNQFKAKPPWHVETTDLSGCTAIVTGSNVGLGYEAALQLLGLGVSDLIVAVRSLDRGEAAASSMRRQYPKAKIQVWELDLCSYESVQHFAERVERQLSRIDFVILNAGRARFEYHKVEGTGHEESFQVNYLSNVFLVILLLPILKAKGPPNGPAHLTIANAALTLDCKFVHRNKDPLFSALDAPENFDRGDTYRVTKLLAHCFLWKLVDYVSADDVVINLADPAFVRGTEFGRDLVSGLARRLFFLFGLIAGRSPKVGASCYIDAVVNRGEETHGCFLMSWAVHPFPGMLYTEEGEATTERVWKETLSEFEFAGARRNIASMKG
ncbi:hypothetical protein GGR56DRAFT_648314 [Xylariaceae sp. FL0804]|nr:hypothetical protein GGR56DRAFT_648314 [Xylariaceae sp. FL0804]